MELGAQDDIYQFRALAIGLQGAFTPLTPIIHRTHLLSTNAEINSAHLGDAGAPFSIIARELVYVTREVGETIGDLADLFSSVAGQCADWLKAERRIRSFQLALARIHSMPEGGSGTQLLPEGTETRDLLLASPFRPGVGAAWSKAARRTESGSSERRVWEALAANRMRLLRNMAGLLGQMRRVQRQVDRLSWVAVRHCHFTAVTARIEASRASSTTNSLKAVAEEIRSLADDIAAAERNARARVLAVLGRAASAGRLLRSESSVLVDNAGGLLS